VITDGIAQYIGQQVEGLTYDDTGSTGNIFLESFPSTPDEAIVVHSTGGSEADTKLGYDAPMFMITVRGTQDPTWAQDTWAAIYALLHGLRYTTLPDGTFLVYCIATQSGPNKAGVDENGRQQFTMNLRTEVTTERE